MASFTYYTEAQIIDAIKNSFKNDNGKTKCLKKGDNFFTVAFHNDGSYFSFEYCEEGITKLFYINGKISGSITNEMMVSTLVEKVFVELCTEVAAFKQSEKTLERSILDKIMELASLSDETK